MKILILMSTILIVPTSLKYKIYQGTIFVVVNFEGLFLPVKLEVIAWFSSVRLILIIIIMNSNIELDIEMTLHFT